MDAIRRHDVKLEKRQACSRIHSFRTAYAAARFRISLRTHRIFGKKRAFFQKNRPFGPTEPGQSGKALGPVGGLTSLAPPPLRQMDSVAGPMLAQQFRQRIARIVAHGLVQRRAAGFVGGIHLRPFAEQQIHNFLAALPR